MLLLPFLTLFGVGLGLFLVGHYFTYSGIAIIGAVLIIAVGGAVTLTDLEQPTGKTLDKSYSDINNSTVNVQTDVRQVTNRTSMTEVFGPSTGQLGLGTLVMLVGATLGTRHMAEESL